MQRPPPNARGKFRRRFILLGSVDFPHFYLSLCLSVSFSRSGTASFQAAVSGPAGETNPATRDQSCKKRSVGPADKKQFDCVPRPFRLFRGRAEFCGRKNQRSRRWFVCLVTNREPGSEEKDRRCIMQSRSFLPPSPRPPAARNSK